MKPKTVEAGQVWHHAGEARSYRVTAITEEFDMLWAEFGGFENGGCCPRAAASDLTRLVLDHWFGRRHAKGDRQHMWAKIGRIYRRKFGFLWLTLEPTASGYRADVGLGRSDHDSSVRIGLYDSEEAALRDAPKHLVQTLCDAIKGGL